MGQCHPGHTHVIYTLGQFGAKIVIAVEYEHTYIGSTLSKFYVSVAIAMTAPNHQWSQWYWYGLQLTFHLTTTELYMRP